MTDWASGRGRDRIEVAGTLAFIALCVVGMAVGIAVIATRSIGATSRTDVVGGSRPIRGTPPTPAPLPTTPVSIADAPNRGSEGAEVVLIEYSEFKCPYCGRFAQDTWPSLVRKYVEPGKVRVVFRHFPLDQLHPFARTAAQAAACADLQGKFWPLHDLMFKNQAQLDAVELANHAKAIGLDTGRSSACVATEGERRVKADETSGISLGVTGTPTFFIGIVQSDGGVLLKQRLAGAQPLTQFETALDRWLGEAATKVK